ncbi:MAG: sulfatase, partial [Sphingobacteriales bacterium]
PNVILIYSDDQGSLDLNIYGAKDLATPNLDRLARNGVRFSQFYPASPVCSPSRASLLTGRYPQRAGLVDNASGNYGSGAGMPGKQFTMAELFKGGGYKTAHIVKWHIGYTPETMPNAQGFDHSFGFMGGCIDNFSHFFYWAGPNRHDLWENGREIYRPGKFFADMMVEEAGTFMKANKSDPFFMYWAINIPHYPIQPDVKWQEYYKNLPEPRRGYAAFVSMMDERVGQLLKKVDELGLTDNTIIVFQADQGHSEEERGFGGGGFAGENRGAKFSLFEGGIQVPAIISWPGHIAKNVVRHQFATNIDWLPTLAEYCNIPLPDRKIDGRSITKIIASDDAPTQHPVFHWQSLQTRDLPQWAVRDGDWKLLHSPRQADSAELNADNLMLIDLKNDRGEKINKAADNPAIVTRLQQLHADWLKQVFED